MAVSNNCSADNSPCEICLQLQGLSTEWYHDAYSSTDCFPHVTWSYFGNGVEYVFTYQIERNFETKKNRAVFHIICYGQEDYCHFTLFETEVVLDEIRLIGETCIKWSKKYLLKKKFINR